jgi:CheY-like chemotaxis protein
MDANPAKLLVFEDDELVADMVQDLLTDAGYSVVRAGNAEEALEMPECASVNLVFTDVVMPGAMDGSQLANAIATKHPGVSR